MLAGGINNSSSMWVSEEQLPVVDGIAPCMPTFFRSKTNDTTMLRCYTIILADVLIVGSKPINLPLVNIQITRASVLSLLRRTYIQGSW